MGAKRWGAPDALATGLITSASPATSLLGDALAFAEEQAKLAKGPVGRLLYMSIKNQAKVGRRWAPGRGCCSFL
jgi:enoyl-CoA hydratase/carnithine racemase